MQSFALYYKHSKVEDIKKCPITKVHFNLWTECDWKNDISYLDIGFLIHNPELVEELNFCIPFVVNKQDIFDLGHLLIDTKLSSAIFNESILKDDTKSKDDVYTFLHSDTSKYDVYFLDADKHLKIQPIEEKDKEKKNIIDQGSLLILNIENLRSNISHNIENNDFYIRFRIKNVNLKKLVHDYSPNRNGFQSIFNMTYTVDFRFNNKRSLPNTFLTEDMKASKQMFVDSLHFLLITKTHVNIFTNTETSSRKLETNIWDDYVRDEKFSNPTSDLIAYHYKRPFISEKENVSKIKEEWKKTDGSYELFLKYSVEKSIVGTYLFITCFIGILCSLIASFFSMITRNYLKKIVCSELKTFFFGFGSAVIIGLIIQGITKLVKLIKNKK